MITIQPMTDEMLVQMMEEHERLNPDLPIRPDIKEALNRYAEQGIKPGDFLTAVLENNLSEALGRADSYNRATLYQIVSYIYNELPSTCWGSPDRVKFYLAEMAGF